MTRVLWLALALVPLAAGCVRRECPAYYGPTAYYEQPAAEAEVTATAGATTDATTDADVISTGGAEAQACGTRGADPCPDGQFCDFPDDAQCGATDRPGTCRPEPEMCTQQYQPACGCDGRTYGNACSARMAGTDVAHGGACGDDPTQADCVVAGCSSQLCVQRGDPGVSTCEHRPEYACYRGATCERQADGQCGWTMTENLRQCLDQAGAQTQ